ncbi:hypothetical protein HNR45_000551 [Negativicoccus succinicivorans]|uniref:Uncharacterized protein n=1 Tax=Negativicoccus succinicivorans TaxID=620903 RepID=A0A841R2B1_9FIRM|nr:hypothetical protein [Negativicoccus succinicivorans]
MTRQEWYRWLIWLLSEILRRLYAEAHTESES